MSEAEKLERQLKEELKKSVRDEDLIYTIKLRLPYANAVDTERIQRASSKLSRLLKTK